MKYIGLLLMAIAVCAFQCEDGSIKGCESNEWLDQQITNAKNQQGQKTNIDKYEYKGQLVFLIDNCVGCADAMQVAYTCTGEQVCQFGGIAGFNTCPDFAETAKFLETVYSK